MIFYVLTIKNYKRICKTLRNGFVKEVTLEVLLMSSCKG